MVEYFNSHLSIRMINKNGVTLKHGANFQNDITWIFSSLFDYQFSPLIQNVLLVLLMHFEQSVCARGKQEFFNKTLETELD